MSPATPAPPQADAVEDDTEAALWSAFKDAGSGAARARLFGRHAAFARNIARRHYRERAWGDLDFRDLQQLAYAGLLEALDRFDPNRGAPFRAFAAHRISGSIQDGLTRESEVREQVSWRHRARRERLGSLVDRTAEPGDTAQAMETLAEIAVGLAIGFMLEGTGLFVGGDREEGDAAPDAATAYDSLAWKEMVAQLRAEVAALPEREHAILREHYMNGVDFDQLAALLGLSKGRISQLHRAALLLLRKRLRERGHFRLGR
ncbi:MAG: sigma-70 family RNA polymerase sigma factor [Rhizomicrobium sp.]